MKEPAMLLLLQPFRAVTKWQCNTNNLSVA